MVGLLNNNDNGSAHVLTQWRQLFFNQSAVRSTEAYDHWCNVERLGLSSNQHEYWKCIPLNKLLVYRFTPPTTSHMISAAMLDALSLTLDADRLVFINGQFSPTLSDSNTGLWKIEVEKGAARLALPVPIQSEVFLHLIESLSQETTRIYLPEGKSAQRPLYLLHISEGNEKKEVLSMLHYRHHIEIEPGAQGQIIEHFTSADIRGYFSGARTTFSVGNNSHLCHIKLALESYKSFHFSHNDIRLGCNALVKSSAFILGSGLTRHQTSVQLNGEGSNLMLNSLTLPSNQDINDICTYVEHNQGYCLSRQLHKVIVRNHGKGVFNGLIKVAKHALRTDSQLINNNLLLNQLGEVNTKPQLEIYADDVKCSHGATIGQIDEEQIFYLRSRGITLKDARHIIIYAFSVEVIEAIGYEKGISEVVAARIANILQGVSI